MVQFDFGDIDLVTTYYPPLILVNCKFTKDINQEISLILHLDLNIQEKHFQYWVPVEIKKSFQERYTLSIEVVDFLNLQSKVQTDSVIFHLTGDLVSMGNSTISEQSISKEFTRGRWKDACSNETKLENIQGNPIFPSIYPEVNLSKIEANFANQLGKLRRSILDDPIQILQRNILQKQIDEVKRFVLDDKHFKDLDVFRPTLEISREMGVESGWIVSVAILLSLEIYLKRWLIKFKPEKYDYKSLKNQSFEDLVGQMQDILNSKHIPYSKSDFGEMIGQRRFRNGIIHEDYTPEETEVVDLIAKTRSFVSLIKQLETRYP